MTIALFFAVSVIAHNIMMPVAGELVRRYPNWRFLLGVAYMAGSTAIWSWVVAALRTYPQMLYYTYPTAMALLAVGLITVIPLVTAAQMVRRDAGRDVEKDGAVL